MIMKKEKKGRIMKKDKKYKSHHSIIKFIISLNEFNIILLYFQKNYSRGVYLYNLISIFKKLNINNLSIKIN